MGVGVGGMGEGDLGCHRRLAECPWTWSRLKWVAKTVQVSQRPSWSLLEGMSRISYRGPIHPMPTTILSLIRSAMVNVEPSRSCTEVARVVTYGGVSS